MEIGALGLLVREVFPLAATAVVAVRVLAATARWQESVGPGVAQAGNSPDCRTRSK